MVKSNNVNNTSIMHYARAKDTSIMQIAAHNAICCYKMSKIKMSNKSNCSQQFVENNSHIIISYFTAITQYDVTFVFRFLQKNFMNQQKHGIMHYAMFFAWHIVICYVFCHFFLHKTWHNALCHVLCKKSYPQLGLLRAFKKNNEIKPRYHAG